MHYNEYWKVIDAGLRPTDLVVFSPEKYGTDTLEDGLYVLQERLGDAVFRDRLVRFVRASIAGWRYALAHRKEAVAIVLRHAGERLDPQKQERMLDEIARLIPDPNRLGYLDPVAYRHTVAVLLSGTVDSVLRREPRDTSTNEIWNEAVKK